MTKELKQEANDFVNTSSIIYKRVIGWDNYQRGAYIGYLAGAEPREKRIAELEVQIEKMKCCMKCEHWYYYKSFCDKDNSYHSEGQSCEHFILRR